MQISTDEYVDGRTCLIDQLHSWILLNTSMGGDMYICMRCGRTKFIPAPWRIDDDEFHQKRLVAEVHNEGILKSFDINSGHYSNISSLCSGV